ncbi:DUF2868 domain-containing protein [Desulfospira joergensenii]|uniref:DUF2868 domain-containing protein n=1 Tax=Desulfospira joergensenii TaxID=53329 RepID=UPI0003B6F6CE|nr:DUF2868 domain-containing protein [Desulfospira joergensenii]
MTLQLKDIIDLDYLLGLDEQVMEGNGGENTGLRGKNPGEKPEDISARDRDIFRQLNQENLDEKQILASWLEFRRLVFFDRSGPAFLPGKVFNLTLGWAARFLVFLGLVTGVGTAYSFLAYHGSRPVNVTLFFTGFVLLPFLLFMGSLVFVFLGRSKSVFQSLMPFLAFKWLPRLIQKTGRLVFAPVEGGRDSLDHVFSLFSRKRLEYGPLFFWPLFVLPSLFALCFSLGTLAGTLFRVVITDMAFGWQSTLSAGAGHVFRLVHQIALPWSWLFPDAVPGLGQIEGSRIILKQGIESLATENLVSWWPFLSMAILFYAILPRILLILAAKAAGRQRVNRFDFSGPRFRKLLIRMQTPVMDMGADESLPGSLGRDYPDSERKESPLKHFESNPVSAQKDRVRNSLVSPVPALILASESIYGEEVLESIVPMINRQLAFDIRNRVHASFDYETDRASLEELEQGLPGHVVLLQEVWQPPIRGILHYLVQLKTQMLETRPLWLFLTRTPGEGDLFVDPDDMDARVWKRAVDKLGIPGIMVEGLSERMKDEG